MPSVMDAPELVEHIEIHALTIKETRERERPQSRRARPGFWRTLAHTITGYLTPTPHESYALSCSAPRPFEMPMDRLVRENPFLAAYGLALI
jgi:hypothetical protein